MIPRDALAAQVQRYVATQVPPHLVVPVTEATCRTVGTLMADPTFTRQLRTVQELLEEIQWLKTQVIHQQRIMASLSTTGTPGRRKTPKRPAAAKKKAAAPRTTSKQPSTATRAFKAGVKQARR